MPLWDSVQQIQSCWPLSSFLHWKLRFHPSVLAQGIMRGSNFGIGHGFHSMLRDMAEKKTDSSACFTVQQARDGKPFIAVQLYRDIFPLLREVLFGFASRHAGRGRQEARRDAERARPRYVSDDGGESVSGIGIKLEVGTRRSVLAGIRSNHRTTTSQDTRRLRSEARAAGHNDQFKNRDPESSTRYSSTSRIELGG